MNEKPAADTPEAAETGGHPPHDAAVPPVTAMPDAPVAEPLHDEPPFERFAPAAPPLRRNGMRALAGALGIGVVVLLVALIWVLAHPVEPAEGQSAIADLRQQVQTLTGRLASVEQKPVPVAPPPPPSPPPVDLGPLEARLTKLEQRPVPQPTDLGPLTARVEAMATKTDALAASSQSAQTALAANLRDTSSALAASLRTTSAALTGSMQSAQTALSNQIGAASEHVQALADRVQASNTATAARLDTVEKRLGSVEQASGQVAGLAARTARTDRLRAAGAALEAGQPLGDIPGAPPALLKYAHDAPPTEASLRLAFPDAARTAGAADAPADQNTSFAQRIWSNVSQAVTIRDGDRVLVGGSSAPLLTRAQHLLEAGDLAAAVSALGGLSGAPAAAMADWVSQAKSLLAARAALTDLAARG